MNYENWMQLAIQLATEGDKTILERARMLDEQVRASMDGMSRSSMRQLEEDRRRGIVKKIYIARD